MRIVAALSIARNSAKAAMSKSRTTIAEILESLGQDANAVLDARSVELRSNRSFVRKPRKPSGSAYLARRLSSPPAASCSGATIDWKRRWIGPDASSRAARASGLRCGRRSANSQARQGFPAAAASCKALRNRRTSVVFSSLNGNVGPVIGRQRNQRTADAIVEEAAHARRFQDHDHQRGRQNRYRADDSWWQKMRREKSSRARTGSESIACPFRRNDADGKSDAGSHDGHEKSQK